jgi:hypothetical protein
MRNVPAGAVNTSLLLALYFMSKIIPMAISALSIYLGFKLFVMGVNGEASIVVNARTASAQLLNAAPGLFFAVGGIAALVVAVWKGSSFSFSRQDPWERWDMCPPYPPSKNLTDMIAERLDRR